MALLLLLLPLLLLLRLSSAAPPPYANYTVGGSAGWLFDARRNAPVANYSAWADAHSFFLGDFLIFNTDTSSTVLQTFNVSTYESCSQREDFGNLTSQFLPDDGISGAIAVELVAEGPSYFFSDADSGYQCRRGMRFRIDVARGRGLPSAEAPQALPPLPPPPAPLERSAGCRLPAGLLLAVAAVCSVLGLRV